MEEITIEFLQTKDNLFQGIAILSDLLVRGGVKRMRVLGIVELAATIALTAYCAYKGVLFQLGFIIMIMMLLALGIYSTLFYAIFYRRMLRKSVDKNFDQFDYSKPTSITLDGETISMCTPEGDYSGPFENIYEVKVWPDLIWLRDSYMNCVPIGRNMVKNEEFDAFADRLEELCLKHDKPFERIAENG